jgi:HlyD family secretion protein
VIDLLSADSVKIQVGDRAKIERWGGSDALDAIVRRIEPTGFTKVSALGIEEQRVRVILDFTTPSNQLAALGHEFRVFARIEINRVRDVAAVPLSALFRVGNEWACFTIEDGIARRKIVNVGLRNKETAQIVSGIGIGEQVIVHPGDRVDEGVAVEPRTTTEN